MCYGCWRDEYGLQVELSDAVLAAADAVEKLYAELPCGGGAHIVTDDWNVEDHSIEFAVGFSEEQGDEPALAALRALQPLSVIGRCTALAIHEGYIDREGKAIHKDRSGVLYETRCCRCGEWIRVHAADGVETTLDVDRVVQQHRCADL